MWQVSLYLHVIVHNIMYVLYHIGAFVLPLNPFNCTMATRASNKFSVQVFNTANLVHVCDMVVINYKYM